MPNLIGRIAGVLLVAGVVVVSGNGLVGAEINPASSHSQNQSVLSLGFFHSCALLDSGGVQCWGMNTDGQLGNDSNVGSPIPVAVSGVSTAIAVSAGSSHSCAVLDSGGVQCWGRNLRGQLGNDSFVGSPIPVAVSGVSTAIAVSAGESHSCAVLASGGVQCWGRNVEGQLGNSSTVDSRVPVAVSGVSTAIAVSAGEAHSCAVLASGGVQCWGGNSWGQLGNDSTVVSRVPVGVSGLSSGVGPTTTSSTTTTVVVRAAPTTAPTSVSYRAANKRVTLRWGAVNGAASYVVTTTRGAQVCATTITNCVVNRLRNGRAYNYLVFSVNADGVRSDNSTRITARPGFQVKRTTLKANRTLALLSIVTTPSKGVKTWRVTSGRCRLQGTRLIAPPTKGTCKLRLDTAKRGSYPAMSTTITVSVR